MRIRILTVSHKLPNWMQLGIVEYTKRLKSYCYLDVIEIAPGIRKNKSQLDKTIAIETKKFLAALDSNSLLIALDVLGKPWSTQDLAKQIQSSKNMSQNIDFLIGATEGLPTEILAKAQIKFSLSKLTFPHTLVRVILVEQLYRAFSILNNHPYHR